MNRFLGLLFVLLLLTSNAIGKPREVTNADRVIAIYNEDWGLASNGQPQLIVCAWDDGFVVWSHDRLNGGAPYSSAWVNPKDFTATLNRLKTTGILDSPVLNNANYGPDSKFTTILIRDGAQELKMQSWHELFENNGNTIAGKRGVTTLAGRPLLVALKDEPSDYLAFRLAWLEVRLAAARLIPSAGKTSKGHFDMHHASARWIPAETIDRNDKSSSR